MNGPAGLISVNASIWVHTKNGKRSLAICGWRLSLCSSALIRMMHMHSVFSLNEWFLSNHTLYVCLFICKKQKSRHMSSHFLIRFLSFGLFLSSCFLPVCLCLCRQPVSRNLFLPPAAMSFCLLGSLTAAWSNFVGFHVCCSLKMFLRVNNERSLYSANLFPRGGIMFWM